MSSTSLNETIEDSGKLIDLVTIDGGRPKLSLLNAVLGVLSYEIIRTFRPLRVLLWLGLALFPVVLLLATLSLIQLPPSEYNDDRYYLILCGILFALLPQVVTVLCMLLWAVPIVNAELEGQTWIYSMIRPGGRRAMLIGKYIVAVLWTGSCTSFSTIAACIVAWVFEIPQVLHACIVMVVTNWLAAITYGALMITLGSIFQRRSMVIAFAYAAGVEAVMGWIPAVINRFTLSYRLRSLAIEWLELNTSQIPQDMGFLFEKSMALHISVLGLATFVLLGFTLWKIERTQHRFQSEF